MLGWLITSGWALPGLVGAVYLAWGLSALIARVRPQDNEPEET